MYGEDIDLSYRVQKMGYKNYYFSESTIIHFKGESTGKKSLKYVKMFYGAMRIFVKKHYSGRASCLNAFFIHIAIGLRAGVSAAYFSLKTKFLLIARINSFTVNKKYKTKPVKKDRIIIAGTDEEYEEVKALLAKAGSEKRITGRVAIDEKKYTDTGSALNAAAQSGKITAIIFCQGKLSYSYIIDKIQNLPKKLSIRFHAKGTESIVGSDSKNTSGEFVYVPDEVE